MRRRRSRNPVLSGDGTSFEEVLTVITVLLLLRVVFMVPMVNLDKAKTVTAKRDNYWSRAVSHVLSRAPDEAALRPYRAAFGMRDMRGSTSRSGNVVYVEAATPDSAFLFVRHVPGQQRFIALRVEGGGQSLSFRRGRLLWSQSEGEWFIGIDTIDYGSHPSSRELEQEFRERTRKERGY